MARPRKRRNENENIANPPKEPCTSIKKRDQKDCSTSAKKKLKVIRISENSDVSEWEEVDEFDGFLEGDAAKNANFIKPKVSNLNNALQYIKTMVVTVVVQKHRPRTADHEEEIEEDISNEDNNNPTTTPTVLDLEFSTPKYEDPIVTNEDAEYNSDGYEIVDVDLF